MKKIIFIISLLIFITMSHTKAQQVRWMTYNVENLFDTKHDSLKNDTEFLPNSDRHWTSKRFYKKMHNVMQVITGIGEWQPPMLVGLCEIENDYVLHAMTKSEPYDQLGYEYIHFESPDARGIDVALLYQPSLFTPLVSRPLDVVLPGNVRGRDILYVCGTTLEGVILHVFQVHFPSRREGAKASESKRVAAAERLKSVIDSIQMTDPSAAIVIMGDFNDNPHDKAPSSVLAALPSIGATSYDNTRLYNLTWDGSLGGWEKGSYYVRGEWEMIDQIIVSGSLINGTLPIRLSAKAETYEPEWLTVKKKKQYSAEEELIPRRTYRGPSYSGGVSDHFPLYVDVKIK